MPLTLGKDEALFRSLSGVSADVIARCGTTGFREAALFTHKGLSGPAILPITLRNIALVARHSRLPLPALATTSFRLIRRADHVDPSFAAKTAPAQT